MKTIEELAREAGMRCDSADGVKWSGEVWALDRFAALVAEQCAQVAKGTRNAGLATLEDWTKTVGDETAEAIRAAFPMPKG